MKQKTAALPIYNFQPEDDLGSLAIRYATLETRNDYDYSEAHRHDYYEVFFFRRGGGVHLVDFAEHKVADNSIHILMPGQVHLLRRAPESHGAVLHFSKDVLPRTDAAYALVQNMAAGIFNHSDSGFNTSSAILALLREELAATTKMQEAILTCLSLLLLKSLPASTEHTVQAQPGTLHHFKAFRRLAEENYRTGQQPAWYAAQLFITERRLNESCKAATGNTVSAYLKERVLLEAKRLLSHSTACIKEVGYHLGFDDPAYFTRFFRKNTGITASDFRQSFQEMLTA